MHWENRWVMLRFCPACAGFHNVLPPRGILPNDDQWETAVTDDIANLTLEYLRRFDQRQNRMMDMLSDLRDRVSSMGSQLSGFRGEFAGLRGDFARLEHRFDRLEMRVERIEHRLDWIDITQAE
jgi:hypothetical protein